MTAHEIGDDNSLDPVKECRPAFPSLSDDFIVSRNEIMPNTRSLTLYDSSQTRQVDRRLSEQWLRRSPTVISLSPSTNQMSLTLFFPDLCSPDNVQLGASYRSSVNAGKLVASGASSVAPFIGASSPKSIIFGSNSTQLLLNLSLALEDSIEDGAEIVVTQEHETNVGPWYRMVDRLKLRGINVRVRIWEVEGSIDTGDVALTLAGLDKVLSAKTRLVAFSGTSNILGEVTNIQAVVELVKARSKAVTSVDCVAFAPHRRMEVEKWGVDFANFSLYKVSPSISISSMQLIV